MIRLRDAPWTRYIPTGRPRDGLDLLARESLPRAWSRHFALSPERPCVSEVGGGSWVTYGELDLRSRRVAARFAAAGLAPGSRILMSAAPSVDLVVAYVAAQRLGLVVVPVNSAYTRREVEHILRDARPSAAIVDERARAEWMSGLDLVCTPDVAVSEELERPLDLTTRHDLALIAYTSGTTGAPKGAMLTSGNLLASAEAVAVAWRWTVDDRLVLALPLFHLHGLGVGLNGTLTVGGSAVLLSRFQPDAVLDAVAARGATLFFGVPTMYARLAESPRIGELARLRLCVSGSAPLAPELHAALAARGGQSVLERYGMTETVMNVSNPYIGERRAGSVGVPLPGVELRLDGALQGSRGEPLMGEILLRGPNVFHGYWERPEATAEAFTADGWFRTGDLGALDADGYLRIVGRIKELIITGGYNVYPREVEDVLRTHPNVADVAVAGVPSDEWGEAVAAWIVPTGDLDPDELIEFARERLARFKCPRAVHIVEKLPRNALGKILKHELQALT